MSESESPFEPILELASDDDSLWHSTGSELGRDFESDRQVIIQQCLVLNSAFEADRHDPDLILEIKQLQRFLVKAIEFFTENEEDMPYYFPDNEFLDQITAAKEVMIEANEYFEDTTTPGMSCVHYLLKIVESLVVITKFEQQPEREEENYLLLI